MSLQDSKLRMMVVVPIALLLSVVALAGAHLGSATLAPEAAHAQSGGPNAACAVALQDHFAAMTGNSNPTVSGQTYPEGLVVRYLIYAPDTDIMVFDIPEQPTSDDGTAISADTFAVGGVGATVYMCDPDTMIITTHEPPANTDSAPSIDWLLTQDAAGGEIPIILGCSSGNTTICNLVGNIVRSTFVGITCTGGTVINFSSNMCQIVKEAARWLRNYRGWSINPELIHCPKAIACDTIKDSCRLKRLTCDLMRIRNVCWDRLGCE